MKKHDYFRTMKVYTNAEFDDFLSDYFTAEDFDNEIDVIFVFEENAHFFLNKTGKFIVYIFNQEYEVDSIAEAFDILWNDYVKPELYS